MDFRMEKSSWVLILFMLITMSYFIISGATKGLEIGAYLQIALYAILSTIALIALCCIPVIVYCYFIKKIPDIDYSINLAAAVTVVGIISELF